ncbi:MAG: alpha/beta hydrolase [Alphaproteobacteria bacterium]|nr:alpha/beta hydrolase [Alphaproteobacteria bacterium]
MSKPSRNYCVGKFGHIHFYDTGGTGAPLVLCPQAPMSARQFDRVYDLLTARGIRAIGVDTPGFGMSDPPPFVPRVEDFATAVPVVLDHLGIAAAHIVGHHTGAMIATEAAVGYPKRILSLIMNGPVPLTVAERTQFQSIVDDFEKPFKAKPDGSHLLDWWKRRSAFANAATDWDRVTHYVAEPLVGLGPFWYGHNAAFAYDHAASIKRVAQRAMILTNTGDQIYSHAQLTRQLRPDFAYVEIPGGGIDIVDEAPAAWVDAVATFVFAKSDTK